MGLWMSAKVGPRGWLEMVATLLALGIALLIWWIVTIATGCVVCKALQWMASRDPCTQAGGHGRHVDKILREA